MTIPEEPRSEFYHRAGFFAGEHTSRDYRGTAHGAYLSGIREAKKIICALENLCS